METEDFNRWLTEEERRVVIGAGLCELLAPYAKPEHLNDLAAELTPRFKIVVDPVEGATLGTVCGEEVGRLVVDLTIGDPARREQMLPHWDFLARHRAMLMLGGSG